MIKVYGAPICPACVELKEILDSKKKKYQYINIIESTGNMKEFLSLRDHNPIYDEIKKSNRIGIPSIVLEDGTILLDYFDLDFDSLEDGDSTIELGQVCDMKTGKC